MKKSDLRTGMRVTTRNGNVFIVLLNFTHLFDDHSSVLISPTKELTWSILDNYNDELLSNRGKDYDILKIEKPEHVYAVLGNNEDYNECYKIIWERKQLKEMTLLEIEKELGYPVKIIK